MGLLQYIHTRNSPTTHPSSYGGTMVQNQFKLKSKVIQLYTTMIYCIIFLGIVGIVFFNKTSTHFIHQKMPPPYLKAMDTTTAHLVVTARVAVRHSSSVLVVCPQAPRGRCEAKRSPCRGPERSLLRLEEPKSLMKSWDGWIIQVLWDTWHFFLTSQLVHFGYVNSMSNT